MATRIKLKRSTTASAVPTTSNLEDGEVALNIADKKLYAKRIKYNRGSKPET